MDRPLIFYSLVNFLGCLTYLLVFDNVFYSAVIAAFFFVLLIINKENNKLILVFFFVIGMFATALYFNPKVHDSLKMRVIDKKGTAYVCTYLNRRVVLENSYINLIKGTLIEVEGEWVDDKEVYNGIIGTIEANKIEIKSQDLICRFYSLRERIFTKYIETYGVEKGGVLLAVCFGEDGYLSYDTKNNVKDLGIAHILCVSGLHMALIFALLEKLIGVYAIIPSFVYLLFIGGRVSAIRAFIMVCTNKLAKKSFKQYDSLSALCLASIIILMFLPYQAISIGYHLSFLACVGIIVYYKKISRKIYFINETFAQNMSLTISAQIFTLPYLMFVFNEVSILSLITNILFLPLFSVIIILGNFSILFLKLPIIFNLTAKINSIFINAFFYIEYLFIKFIPLTMQFNYFDGIIVLLIYICYMFFKKGYDWAKYVPVFLLVQQFIIKLNF